MLKEKRRMQPQSKELILFPRSHVMLSYCHLTIVLELSFQQVILTLGYSVTDLKTNNT